MNDRTDYNKIRIRSLKVSTRTSSRQAGRWMEFSWWVKWVTPAPSILLVCRSLLTQITQNEPKGKIQKQIRLETMLLCCYRVNRALRRSLLYLKSSNTSTSCAFSIHQQRDQFLKVLFMKLHRNHHLWRDQLCF